MTESLTLYELNHLVRRTVEGALDDTYWVQGEVSEARAASNGHFYMELVQKDARSGALVAKARATIWRPTYVLLAAAFERATGQRLRDGLKVCVEVRVSFHELYGYSLTVCDIDPTFTLGDLARRRREILARLEEEGILHDNQELPLPAMLNRVAVISSATAAGYGDFRHQLLRNDDGLRFTLRLFPAMMQGARVEESILAALDDILAEADRWDAVVIIRGGGATSDLSDFDTYLLAAACAQFPLPILTGIGHERDETVLDSVAHTPLKTPTAVAAFLIARQQQQARRLTDLQRTLTQLSEHRLHTARLQLERLTALLPARMGRLCQDEQHRLSALRLHLHAAVRQCLKQASADLAAREVRVRTAVSAQKMREEHRLELLARRLEAVDPARLLARGYSLILKDGKLVRRASDVKAGDKIVIQPAEGRISATVDKIDKK